MCDMLRLRANYKESIHQFKSILPEDTTDINGTARDQDIVDYLHRRRVQHGLNDLVIAYDFLGFRRGETIPNGWLKGMNETGRSIFLKHYVDKQGYTVIASQMGLDREMVAKIFKSSLQQVMKNAGGE